MPNTYSEIHLQFVFAVQNRASLIKPSWEKDLYKYITGIVQNNGHKMICVNGMPDHLHILTGMRPTQSVSDLLQDIKGESSKLINKNRMSIGKFTWQDGYAAFSYSRSDLSQVIDYINNQKLHHGKISFLEEYRKLLDEFEIAYDEKYLPLKVL